MLVSGCKMFPLLFKKTFIYLRLICRERMGDSPSTDQLLSDYFICSHCTSLSPCFCHKLMNPAQESGMLLAFPAHRGKKKPLKNTLSIILRPQAKEKKKQKTANLEILFSPQNMKMLKSFLEDSGKHAAPPGLPQTRFQFGAVLR